jgi:hypothetical protein
MTLYDPIYLSETEHAALDHSAVPGVQSGATAPLRGLYDISGTVASGASYPLSWAEAGYGHESHMLDLSDPFLPVLTTGGVVTISGDIVPSADPTNPFMVFVDMDLTNDDLSVRIPGSYSAQTFGRVMVTASYYIPSGGALKLQAAHSKGSDLDWGGQIGVVVIPS